MKRSLLLILSIALVATFMGFVVSCSPSPEESKEDTQNVPPPGTLVFKNDSSVAPDLLSELRYEKKANAHVFYLKTTVVTSKYKDALDQAVSGILGNNFVGRDIWSFFIIAIDRNSFNNPTNNIIKLADYYFRTQDPEFQFDAIIRAASTWDVRNTEDRVPFKAENNNVLLEMLNDNVTAQDIVDNNIWALVGAGKAIEKKFQGTEGNFVADTQEIDGIRVAAGFRYENGYYVLTIPFDVIGENDIKKVAVFGAQRGNWREAGGDYKAAVKPLGTNAVVIPANDQGIVENIPVATLPQ